MRAGDFGLDRETHHPVQAWELRLDPAMFPNGYNPFEVDNVLGNHMWLRYAQDNMSTYFRRRGLIFVDGKPLSRWRLLRSWPGHRRGR